MPDTDHAYHDYFIASCDDGAATVISETNDDNDDGWPDGSVERWELQFPTLAQALKHTGTSRTGISGVVVNVYLDGAKI